VFTSTRPGVTFLAIAERFDGEPVADVTFPEGVAVVAPVGTVRPVMPDVACGVTSALGTVLALQTS